MAEETPEATPEATQNLAIQKIYTKDISFESPNSPFGFQDEWNPDVSVDLNTDGQALEKGNFEVILKVTVTAKNKDKTVFLAEVQQAGVFQLTGFDDEQQGFIIGSYCPGTLFPYAREVISSLVTNGGYPPVVLAPVNFEALYQEHMKKQLADKEEATQTH